jgi:hypothetical protein
MEAKLSAAVLEAHRAAEPHHWLPAQGCEEMGSLAGAEIAKHLVASLWLRATPST